MNYERFLIYGISLREKNATVAKTSACYDVVVACCLPRWPWLKVFFSLTAWGEEKKEKSFQMIYESPKLGKLCNFVSLLYDAVFCMTYSTSRMLMGLRGCCGKGRENTEALFGAFQLFLSVVKVIKKSKVVKLRKGWIGLRVFLRPGVDHKWGWRSEDIRSNDYLIKMCENTRKLCEKYFKKFKKS